MAASSPVSGEPASDPALPPILGWPFWVNFHSFPERLMLSLLYRRGHRSTAWHSATGNLEMQEDLVFVLLKKVQVSWTLLVGNPETCGKGRSNEDWICCQVSGIGGISKSNVQHCPFWS